MYRNGVKCGEIEGEYDVVMSDITPEREAITKDNKCRSCKWYAMYEGVCCNSDSDHVADFMDKEDWCNEYEYRG